MRNVAAPVGLRKGPGHGTFPKSHIELDLRYNAERHLRNSPGPNGALARVATGRELSNNDLDHLSDEANDLVQHLSCLVGGAWE
jgi:hypothetical protein